MKDIPTNLTNPAETPPADSEKLLRAILDNSPGNTILLDKNYKILCFNKVIKNTFLTLTGKEIHIGDDYRQYSSFFLKDRFFEAFEKAVKGKPTDVEAEAIFGDAKIWFRHTLTPVYEPNGVLLGVSFVAINIDKRKQAELALKDMAESFEAIIENTSESILLIDKNYKVLQFNRTAKERIIASLQKELVAGADFRQFLYPGREEIFYSMFQSALNGESRNTEVEAAGKYGAPVWISTKMFPVYDRHKNIMGVSILAENIEVRKQAEMELKKREQNLQKFNHELTLLNAINDTILTTETETELYHKIVKCIVEKGKYKLAWVCFYPDADDPEQVVKPHVAAGATEYLDNLRISLKDPYTSKGPTATVLQQGSMVITNNVGDAAYFKPWLSQARKFGIQASIVLPLKTEPPGAINIYAANIDAFDEEEASILQRLANNVSLAVEGFRIKKEKEKAGRLLNERMKELATIYQVNELLQDDNERIESVFQKMAQMLGSGWQYPEVCEAKIEFNGHSYTSPSYQPSAFCQTAHFKTQDGKKGSIEIVYTQPMPDEFEGPFLKEERDLINTLAESVQTHYNKKLNRKELMQLQANLKTIMDNTDVGHLLLDSDYNIITYNQRFSSSYAVVSGIKMRKKSNFIQLLLDDRRHTVKASFEKVRETKTAFEYETTYTPGNDNFYFNIVIMPVIDRGKVIGFCLSAYDITRRKLMELERQKMIDDLVQRNTDLEQFSYIVSHNLRAPIANIKGLLNLLATPIDETTTRNMLGGIDMAAQRVDEVIHDLNHILQTRREVTEPYSNVNLQTLVKKVVSGIPHLINESGTTITTNFEEAENIKAIPGYMTSIFHNLITNGIRYAQPGRAPRMHISSHVNKGTLQLRFKDNGTGIDLTKYRNQLFGLYKRFHQDLEGKGIGLFMTKTQVEVMNGRIDVTSNPGEGSEFILTFPQ